MARYIPLSESEKRAVAWWRAMNPTTTVEIITIREDGTVFTYLCTPNAVGGRLKASQRIVVSLDAVVDEYQDACEAYDQAHVLNEE